MTKTFSKNSIVTFIIILIVVIHNYWLYLFNFTLDRFNIEILLIFISFIVIGKKKLYGNSSEKNIIFIFFVLYLIQVFLSSFSYGQSIFNSFFAEKYFFVILLFFILAFYMKNEQKLRQIEMIIVVFTLILSILLSVQSLILHNMGIELLNIDYSTRIDGVRVLASTHFIEVGTLLSVALYFKKKWTLKGKILLIVTFIMGNIDLIFVSKTRMSILIVWTTVGIILLTKDVGLKMKNIAKRILFIVLIIFFINQVMNSELFKLFVAEFNVTTVSTTNRIGEIEYYTKSILSSPINFIFGKGFVYDQNIKYLYVIQGYQGVFSRSDIGLLGFIHEFGLAGFIWYLYIVFHIGNIIVKLRKNKKYPFDLIVLYLYFIFGSGTLFILNPERIIFFPLLLAMSSFYSTKKLE